MKQGPFIHLLQTINKNYFYDVNRNELVETDIHTYAYLENALESDLNIAAAKNLPGPVRKLLECGYLSNRRVKEIEHPAAKDLELILSRRMQKITLQLTQNCNFRCTYCHYTANNGSQRSHTNKNMTLDMAKKAILFLREHSVDSPEVFIGFYGGEPLLEFKMLKNIVSFAESSFRGKKINYTITTNSVLFNDEIIEYFMEHQIQAMISLDGPKIINDRNRVFAGNHNSTFDAIIKKLMYIKGHYKKFFDGLSINMVMDPQHDFDLINSIFHDYPYLKKINISATIIDDVDSETPNVYSEAYSQKAEYQEFLAYLSVLNRFPEKSLSPIILQLVTKLKELHKTFAPRDTLSEKDAPGGPCIPGEVRLMVTAEGNFIVCERVNEISDAMIIGNLKKGIDYEKAKNLLNVAKVTSEQCLDCWVFSNCNLCAKYADNKGVLAASNRLSKCGSSQRQFIRKLEEKALMQEAEQLYGEGLL